MPRSCPEAARRRVSLMSSADGSGSPLGCECAARIAALPARMAGLNTSRGYVAAAVMCLAVTSRCGIVSGDFPDTT